MIRPAFHLDADGRGLPDLIAEIRSAATRVFTRRYGDALGQDVARRVDFHRAGVEPGDPASSPIHEGVVSLRDALSDPGTRPGLDLSPRIRIHLDEGRVLAVLEHGGEEYAEAIRAIPGAYDDGCWPDALALDTPDGRLREAWAKAASGPALGRGLALTMFDEVLPAMRYPTLRRFFPTFETRCRKVARALLFASRTGRVVPSGAEEAREFRRYLSSAVGEEALDRETRTMARRLRETIEREDASSYPTRPVPPRVREEAGLSMAGAPGTIDHADVIEASDGKVFVAVMDAGLARDERVLIQVADRNLAFVQGGRDFGGVPDVPYAAVSLLKETNEAVVVEMSRVPGRREIKARHHATVRDDSLDRDYGHALATFRSAAERARRATTVKELQG